MHPEGNTYAHPNLEHPLVQHQVQRKAGYVVFTLALTSIIVFTSYSSTILLRFASTFGRDGRGEGGNGKA